MKKLIMGIRGGNGKESGVAGQPEGREPGQEG